MTTITIERIREALKKHAAAKTLAEAWILADENEDALSGESLTEVLTHIDQLRAEIHASDLAVAEYRQQCLDNAQEIARLRAESEERLQNCAALVAENERLRKDAKRYRWLAAYARSTSEHWGGRWSLVIDGPAPKSHNSEDDLDAAIDAAMK